MGGVPPDPAPPPPLTGIRVVEFGQFIAGPGAGGMLAALGADVVKVEPPTGDATRGLGRSGVGMFRAANRGKRSLAVDLRNPAGRDIALRLIARADVLVHNMRPGAMDRLGLGAETVCPTSPRLVYAAISGFGSDPAPPRPALDIVAQAESGMMSTTGLPDGEPLRIGFAVTDHAASTTLCLGVLAALYRREQTGRGEIVETSLFHTALGLQASLWSQYFATGVVPHGFGNAVPGLAPAGDVIRVRDGAIVFSAYTDAHWHRLCALLDRPGLGTDARFVDNPARARHRPELLAIVRSALGDRGADECVDWFVANGIVAGRIREYPDVPESEAARAAEVFGAGPGLEGTDRFVTAPCRLGGATVYATGRPPALGEHSRELLAGLDLTAGQIDALAAAGVIIEGENR